MTRQRPLFFDQSFRIDQNYFRFRAKCPAPIDCPLDSLKQYHIFDRLLKKVHGAAFHRANAGIYSAETREEYD